MPLLQLTEDDLGELGATSADEPREAHDLAGADLEGDATVPVAADVLHAKHDRARRAATALEDLAELASHHVAHDLLFGQLGGGLHEHEATIAQDGDAVRELEDLVESVADVDDGDPLRAEAAHEREESLDLLVRERGRGLVQSQDPHPRLHGAHDLDELALRRGQLVPHPPVRQDALEAILRQLTVDLGVEGAAIDEGSPSGQLTGEDVLRDIHPGDDLGLLVDDADAGRPSLSRIGESQLLAVDGQRSRIGLVVTVEDLEQRGLARAVLAQEGEHLAGPDVERDIVEGLDVGEGPADTADLEDAGACGRRGCGGLGSRGEGHALGT
jgi:hypothetical protein